MGKIANLTLPTCDQVFGDYNGKRLNVLEKYGNRASLTDLCTINGSRLYPGIIDGDELSSGRIGYYYIRNSAAYEYFCGVEPSGKGFPMYAFPVTYGHVFAIRPVLKSPYLFSKIIQNKRSGYNGVDEVEFGEYLQYAANPLMQKTLTTNFKNGENIYKTQGSYTLNLNEFPGSKHFCPFTYNEYEYQGKRYVRVKFDVILRPEIKLYNGLICENHGYVWLEVLPVVWLIDYETELLISKRLLVSNIGLGDDQGHLVDFNESVGKRFLDKYMFHDLFQRETLIYGKDGQVIDTNSTSNENNNLLTGLKIDNFNEIFSDLTQQEKQIISLTLGNADGVCYSTEVVANLLGVSIEEVIRVSKKGLEIYQNFLERYMSQSYEKIQTLARRFSK